MDEGTTNQVPAPEPTEGVDSAPAVVPVPQAGPVDQPGSDQAVPTPADSEEQTNSPDEEGQAGATSPEPSYPAPAPEVPTTTPVDTPTTDETPFSAPEPTSSPEEPTNVPPTDPSNAL